MIHTGYLIASAGVLAMYSLAKIYLTTHNKKLQEEFPIVESDKIKQHSVILEVNGKRYRVVYIAHKLGPAIPLIVFIHGLGAQIVQFEAQIEHFSQTANILAIDLLGHGQSEVTSNTSYFNLHSMALDLVEIYKRYQLSVNVIVSHSLGSALSSLMYPCIKDSLTAMVLIGPRHSIEDRIKYLGYMPVIVWDTLRYFDQKKRLESQSLKEFLSLDATEEVKRKQLAINLTSKSLTLTRILRNIPSFPTDNNWKDINVPVQCLIGQHERVNRTDQLEAIEKSLPNAYTHIVVPNSGHNCHLENPGFVNAIISHFLVDDVKIKTLDASHQMLVMAKQSYKWSMKNYEKWKRTASVSSRIGTSRIRGMKVMRDGDDEHSPVELLRKYPTIGLVVDITKDTPPYDTSRVNYCKIPTESKIPPSHDQVSLFINKTRDFLQKDAEKDLVVHCHYGFNRTGFFVCSYLIEAQGYSVDEALEAWKEGRSPGIKHGHFKDELYLRYHR